MLGKMLNSSLSQAEGSGTMSTSAGKLHLKKLINKVSTSVNLKNHREKVTFVRSMFCRQLKQRYDNLTRTQLQGWPFLAIDLRASVDAASDMLRQAETRGEPSSRLADLSVVMRKVSPNWMLVYLCKNPSGFLAQCAAPFGKTVRRLVRREVVEVLTGIQCFLVAHKEAQEHTRAVLVAHGSQDGFLDEVNKVCSESDKSMKLAEMYLARLNSLELAGETILQLREGLRARRTALELCDRMMKHIHHEAHEGAINPREEAKLLHELGHDADQLRKGVAPTPDGTGGKNQKAISVAEAGRFMQGFMKVHMQMQRKIDDFNDYGALKAKPFTFHKVHGTMADLKEAQKKEVDVSMHAVSEQGAAKQDQDPRAQRAQLKKAASAKKAGDGENAV